MLTAVTGVYRNGSIELSEKPANVEEGAEVVVTFLPPKVVEPSPFPVSLGGAWAGKIPDRHRRYIERSQGRMGAGVGG